MNADLLRLFHSSLHAVLSNRREREAEPLAV
jgi:hypothetical protein